MAKRNEYGARSYGKRSDYLEVLRRRTIRKEILIWAVEIIAVVGVAFLIAYYLM